MCFDRLMQRTQDTEISGERSHYFNDIHLRIRANGKLNCSELILFRVSFLSRCDRDQFLSNNVYIFSLFM